MHVFPLSAHVLKPFRKQINLPTKRRVVAAGMAKHPSKSELLSLPGVASSRDPATEKFIFQQTMFRIKDPERSLDFYTRVMGLQLLEKLDFAESSFSLYFLGQYEASQIPENSLDRTEWTFSRPGCLELTHNWGTEKEEKDPYYHNGNKDPQGFGHIGFEVPDLEAACDRFEALGVKFVKKPSDGRMKSIAFIQDPDGYWIEIFNSKANRALLSS